MIFQYLLVILSSYLLGSIPTAFLLVSSLLKKDVRESGTKNTGALNTFRIFKKEKGKGWGIAAFLGVFFFDGLKAVAACLIAINLLPDYVLALTLASFFAVLGHNYSLFLKFRGGRGAASLGGIFLFFDWRVLAITLSSILLFIFLFELVEKKKVNFGKAITTQVLGRLFGEAFALLPVYYLHTPLFLPALFAIPLIIIRHKKRLEEQIKSWPKTT
ncbi:MAG: glycerol-3-phosphate acyltransferase [Candidatus Paceibacterota bacterium]|jgi:glycerol-3-phosphate acyltransferase PlsY